MRGQESEQGQRDSMLADELGLDLQKMATVQVDMPVEYFTYKKPEEKKRERRKLKPISKKKRFDSVDKRIEMGQVERQSEWIHNQNRDAGKFDATAEYLNTYREVTEDLSK